MKTKTEKQTEQKLN